MAACATAKKKAQMSLIPEDWRLPSAWQPESISNRKNLKDIPRQCRLLTHNEIQLTEDYDATQLTQDIKEGNLKCVDVTRAFCKVRSGRAIIPINTPIHDAYYGSEQRLRIS